MDQAALEKLLARGWRSCGAHSFRTGNHNNAELTGQVDQKLDKNGDVAGFYTNLTDGPSTNAASRIVHIQRVHRSVLHSGDSGWLHRR